jgi:hypothetical protein
MSDNIELTPIEESFLEVASPYIKSLQCQVWVDGRYRVDFYIPQKRLIIELDGHEYHSSRDQRTRDAQRDRYLLSKGFTTIRFTGTEIFRNVNKCVEDTIRIAHSLKSHNTTDLSNRDIKNPNPDEFKNHTYYCTYMQKILNILFKKHDLEGKSGAHLVLKREGFDDLSVGMLDDNQIYVAYTFSLNGDRCVDPEVILHRYFDIYTNRFELIPISFENYRTGFTFCAEVHEAGKIEVYDNRRMLEMAEYIEGMARRMEFWGILDADVKEISRGE